MYKIVQFSPTGNTSYLASLLSSHLDSCSVSALEQTNPETLDKSEHLIIMFAIHAFNAPKTVQRFVQHLPKDKSKMISLIGVGCNDMPVNFGAANRLRKILQAKAYSIVVDEVLAMPLTFIMSFPEKTIKEQIKEAKKRIEEISEGIKRMRVSKKKVPFMAKLLSKIGKVEVFAAKIFGLELYAKDTCTKCNKCVRKCPEKNIRLKERGKISFGFNCIMCMRCIYSCPAKAIEPRISKFIPIKNGYSLEKYLK